jgi:altronate hydrolase
MKSYNLTDFAVLLHPDDDVAIARVPIAAGTVLLDGGRRIEARGEIPPGHKIARRARAPGEPLRRYGQPIGVATVPIQAGDHVHVHNISIGGHRVEYEAGVVMEPPATQASGELHGFEGFCRSDGRVGTRNFVAVLSTVNCSASVCRAVAERFRGVPKEYPNVDGVVALTHKSGCESPAGTEDYEALMRVLGGYARHPNVAGCVLVGLGCEKLSVAALRQSQALAQAPAFLIQEQGGSRATIEAVSACVRRLLPAANEARRTPRPASDLVLATNCGGSDGYSGITANPALGWAVDELVRSGGTAVFAETPEIYGAEHLLLRRAASREVAAKLSERLRWWNRYCGFFEVGMEGNPGPGNIASGISTIFEKSLGAIAKSGTGPLVDVLRYGEPISARGLVFMDTPGFDPVSVTGLVAGGATVIAFTTGCGSVFGSAVAPTVKLAATIPLFRRMEDDMDMDCGVILEGATIAEVGRRVFAELFAVASGKRTKSEAQGTGEEEFAPWVIGPVL